MANSNSLSKLRSAGRLCKLGAGVVTALGLVAIGLYMSTLVQILSGLGQSQGSPYAYISYGGVISSLFFITAPTLFFAIVLYALGILMDFMGAETKPEPRPQKRGEENEDEDEGKFDDEHIQIVPLPADMR